MAIFTKPQLFQVPPMVIVLSVKQPVLVVIHIHPAPPATPISTSVAMERANLALFNAIV